MEKKISVIKHQLHRKLSVVEIIGIHDSVTVVKGPDISTLV